MNNSSWTSVANRTSPSHTNNTTNSMPFNEVTAVIYAIVFIVGFMGNTLAIYVVARYTKMKTVTNMYILNLAVADELYILGIPFLGTNSALSYWPFGDFLCKEEFNTCNISWPDSSGVWSIVFILYTTILGFFGPLVIISLCYLFIVIKVKSAGARAGLTRRRRSERKVTRMVVVIVVVFFLCWMPFYTANIVNLIYVIPETQITAAIYFSLVILPYVNSCANPVLYGFLSDNFKQSIQKALCFKRTFATAGTDPTGGQENAAKSVQMEIIRNPDCEPFTSKTATNGK
ncbi:transcript variant X2 [Nothobranchius furzeri]|uniref:Transcript variant X2 n=1 Tax=Nothobranchius furzeri TaxID=105023 RepID=A0A9D2YIB0_NOTFU|nr:somatostatin receptor type 5 isoform X2 [Nothobranchius furzeri]KAF7221115.1 transcript variant X2 [Nothobranchius furzeri]